MDAYHINSIEDPMFSIEDFLSDEGKQIKKLRFKLNVFFILMILHSLLINLLLILFDENFTKIKFFSYFNKINICYNTLIIIGSIFFYCFFKKNILEFFKLKNNKATIVAKALIWFIILKTIIDENIHIFCYLYYWTYKENANYVMNKNLIDFFQFNLLLLNSLKFVTWQFLISSTCENKYFSDIYKIKYFWKIIFISFFLYNLTNLIYIIIYFKIGVFNFFLIISENLIFIYFLYYQISIVNKMLDFKKNTKENFEILIKINNFLKQNLEKNSHGVIFNLFSKKFNKNGLSNQIMMNRKKIERKLIDTEKNWISNSIYLNKIDLKIFMYKTKNYLENFTFNEKIKNFIISKSNKYIDKLIYIRNLESLNERLFNECLDATKKSNEDLEHITYTNDVNEQHLLENDYFSEVKLMKSKSVEYRKKNKFLFKSNFNQNRKLNVPYQLERQKFSTFINNYKIKFSKIDQNNNFPLTKMNQNPINFFDRHNSKKDSKINKYGKPFKESKIFKNSKIKNNNLIKEYTNNLKSSMNSSQNNYSRLMSKFRNLADKNYNQFNYDFEIKENINNLLDCEKHGDSCFSSELCHENNEIDMKISSNNERIISDNEDSFGSMKEEINETKFSKKRVKFPFLESKRSTQYIDNKLRNLDQTQRSYDLSSVDDEQIINFENFIPNSDLWIKKGIDKYFVDKYVKKEELQPDESQITEKNNNIIIFKNSFGKEENFNTEQQQMLNFNKKEKNKKKKKSSKIADEKKIINKPIIKSRNRAKSIIFNFNRNEHKNKVLNFENNRNQRKSISSNVEKKNFQKIENFLNNNNRKVTKAGRTQSNFDTGKFQELSITETGINFKNKDKKNSNENNKNFRTNIINYNQKSILNNINNLKLNRNHEINKNQINKDKKNNLFPTQESNFLNSSDWKNHQAFSGNIIKYNPENKVNYEHIKETQLISLNELIKKESEIKKEGSNKKYFHISLPEDFLKSLQINFKESLKNNKNENNFQINNFEKKLVKNAGLEKDDINFKERETLNNEVHLTLGFQSQHNFLEKNYTLNIRDNLESLNSKSKDQQPINFELDELFQLTPDIILDKKIKNLFKNINLINSYGKTIEYDLFLDNLKNILLEHDFDNLYDIGPFIIREKFETYEIKDGFNKTKDNYKNNENFPNYEQSKEKNEKDNFYIKFSLQKIPFKISKVKNNKKIKIKQTKQDKNINVEKNTILQNQEGHRSSILEDQNKSNFNLIFQKTTINTNKLYKSNEEKSRKKDNIILILIKKIENFDEFYINKILKELGNIEFYETTLDQNNKENDFKKLILKENEQIDSIEEIENSLFNENIKTSKTLRTLNDLKNGNNKFSNNIFNYNNNSNSNIINKDYKYSLPPQKYQQKKIINLRKNPTFNVNNISNKRKNNLNIGNQLHYSRSSSNLKNTENFKKTNSRKYMNNNFKSRDDLKISDKTKLNIPSEYKSRNFVSTFILDNNIITNNLNSYCNDSKNCNRRESMKTVTKLDITKLNFFNHNQSLSKEFFNLTPNYNILFNNSEHFFADIKTLKTINDKNEEPTFLNNSSRLNYNNIGSSLMIEKLSALLHDFKHIVYDNVIYFDYLISKYLRPEEFQKSNPLSKQALAMYVNPKFQSQATNFKDSNYINKKIINYKNNNFEEEGKFLSKNILDSEGQSSSKFFNLDSSKGIEEKILQQEYLLYESQKEMLTDELNYLDVMKEYTISLVLNITNFISENDFLPAKFEKIDFLKLINLMIKIFERRLEYENSLISQSAGFCIQKDNKNNQMVNKKSKNILIKSFINDSENKSYKELYSNQNLLISLFYNILSNSFKYTNQGEIIIESLIEERFSLLNIIVKISDSGSGIPDDILKNWGKAFNFKDKTKGTGLGQFLINMISSKLGLKISKPEKNINSSTKTGTIIEICIPIRDENSIQERNGILSKWNVSSDKSILKNLNNLLLNQNIIKNSTLNLINSNTYVITPNSSDNFKKELSLRESSNNVNLSDFKNLNNFKSKANNNYYNISSNKSKENQSLNYDSGKEDKTIKYSNNSLVFDYIQIMEKNNLSKFNLIEIEENTSVNKLNLQSINENIANDNYVNRYGLKDRPIYIMCLDDDQLFLSMLNSNLVKFANENKELAFEFIYVTNFKDFFIEYIKFLHEGIIIDFFLFDQNISDKLTGYEIFNIVNFINKNYFKENISNIKHNFIFITEDMKLMKFKSNQNYLGGNNIEIDSKNIFSKMQFKDICKRLKEILFN